jgi:hypothetical protein
MGVPLGHGDVGVADQLLDVVQAVQIEEMKKGDFGEPPQS